MNYVPPLGVVAGAGAGVGLGADMSAVGGIGPDAFCPEAIFCAAENICV